MADPKYTYGTGKRKTAIARVKLLSGSGSIVVNGRAFQEYFPSLALQNIVLEPFKVTGTLNKMDAAVKVVGGGVMGQAGALRHGIARALVESDEGLRSVLRQYGLRSNAIERKPARSMNLTLSKKEFWDCIEGNYGPVVEDFEAKARECIDDGAEVLIAGGGVLSMILTRVGLKEVDRVPVIDPLLIAIKLAEMMVDLYKSGIPVASRKGIYQSAPAEIKEGVKKYWCY